MINRKVLYGYQIRNGALEIVPEEQRTVSMVFTLYNAGASYQAISDALNGRVFRIAGKCRSGTSTR